MNQRMISDHIIFNNMLADILIKYPDVKMETQMSNANRMCEMKMEIPRISTMGRYMTPVKTKVLIMVEKITEAINNLSIELNNFRGRGAVVEISKGNTNNGTFILKSR